MAWFALVAMLVLALAPAASRAAASHGGGNPWLDVCSSSGLLPAAPTDDGSAHAALDHCPLCSQFGHAPVLPAQAVPFIAPQPVQAVAFSERMPPRARPGLSQAQPRGPPPQA